MSARRMWRALRSLSGPERRLLVELGFATFRTLVRLRLRRADCALASFLSAPAPAAWSSSPADADGVASLAARFFRRIPVRLSCLERAIILRRVLARRGIPAELKIGVAKPGAELQAHAWLVCEGRILLDGPDLCARFPAVLMVA
ncbi:MAG TPA: lasso peptide biosynthesis B2 protein [bacterium]